MAQKKRNKVDELTSIYWIEEVQKKTGKNKQKDIADLLCCDSRMIRHIASGSRSPKLLIYNLCNEPEYSYFNDIFIHGPCGLPLWCLLSGNVIKDLSNSRQQKKNAEGELWLELMEGISELRSHKQIKSFLISPFSLFVTCLVIIKCLNHYDYISDKVKKVLVEAMLENDLSPYKQRKLDPIALNLPFRYSDKDVTYILKKISPVAYSFFNENNKPQNIIPPNPRKGALLEENIWVEMGMEISEEDWLRM